MNRRISRLTLSLMVFITGCAIGPSYEQPAFSPRPEFIGASLITGEQSVSRPKRWWDGFEDPQLSSLVQEGLATNLSVIEAEQRIRRARANRTLIQSDLLPGVQTSASYEESEISEIRSGGNITDRGQTVYDAGFDALWELDLWGRIRRAVEAGRAEESAAVADFQATQQSMAAEIVRSYLELRGAQRQAEVAERNARAQAETVRLTRAQFDAGQVTELDVARARTQLALTEASAPRFHAQARAAIFRLSVLLGREPGALLESLSPIAPIPLYRTTIGLDSPSDMLRRQPTVWRAEEELKAAVATIGVELGEYFPKLELVGALSVEGASWDALRNDPTRVYSFGPRLTWRGLDGGRVSSRVEGARADAAAAEARYRLAVLTALEEVEQSLSSYGAERLRLFHVGEAFVASRTAADLAKRQYEAGAIDLLTLLDAERRMLEAEDSLAQGETQAMVSLVAAMKALGVPAATDDTTAA